MPTYTALMHMHRAVKTIQRDIDNIIVDVFKIMCCSEPTDSFMVNVTVAQLSGHSRGKVLQQPGHVPRLPPPPPGVATVSDITPTSKYTFYRLTVLCKFLLGIRSLSKVTLISFLFQTGISAGISN